MTRYVDTSALVKRYVDEPEAAAARRLLLADTTWVTATHTIVEVYRTLHRRLDGTELGVALDDFRLDWARMLRVHLDEELCRRAGELAVLTGARTADALHLAACERVGGAAVPFLTYDVRQAAAARSLGWVVLGV